MLQQIKRPNAFTVSTGKYRARNLSLKTLRWLRTLQHTRTSTATSPFLKDEYAPVDTEIATRELPVVEGELPRALNGLYIRTGPNPQHRPDGGYLWIDGEAMVHAVHFGNGKARAYCNHWLRCARFGYERAAGHELWPRFGDLKGVLGVLVVLWFNVVQWAFPNKRDDCMTGQLGNTSLVFHNRKLLALMEGGYPFLLRFCKGIVESMGAFCFNGKLKHAVTAHPKVDPRTGELLTFCYSTETTEAAKKSGRALCTYNTVSATGQLSRDYPIDVSRSQIMHDFAITENYAVFMDHALLFDTQAMVKDGGLPFVCDTITPCRIGLLPRADPTAGVRWFEVDPFVVLHTCNAWEEGDFVHLAVCRYPKLDLSSGLFSRFTPDYPEVHRYSLNLRTGEHTLTNLVPKRFLDFPVVPAQLTGTRARYVYCAEGGAGTVTAKGGEIASDSSFTAYCKVDMLAEEGQGLAGEIRLPAGHVSGEASFVPRDADALLAGRCAEDDGWLVAYVTDTQTMTSYCMVYDAATMSAQPVAKVALPQRVPMGFHGLFVPQAQLDCQAPVYRESRDGITVMVSDAEPAPA